MTDGASARSLGVSGEAATLEGWTPGTSRANDDGASSTSAETALPPGIARRAMTDEVSAMAPESATSIEPTRSAEPMAAAVESSEEAAVVNKEVNGVRVVAAAVKRVVVAVVAGGVGVVVVVPVAVVVGLRLRIRGAGIGRRTGGVVGDDLLGARIRGPHVDGPHVSNDGLADSRFSEPKKIVVAHFGRKLQAVRLGVGEHGDVGSPGIGQPDELLEK
jgi:hypothetical protein